MLICEDFFHRMITCSCLENRRMHGKSHDHYTKSRNEKLISLLESKRIQKKGHPDMCIVSTHAQNIYEMQASVILSIVSKVRTMCPKVVIYDVFFSSYIWTSYTWTEQTSVVPSRWLGLLIKLPFYLKPLRMSDGPPPELWELWEHTHGYKRDPHTCAHTSGPFFLPSIYISPVGVGPKKKDGM